MIAPKNTHPFIPGCVHEALWQTISWAPNGHHLVICTLVLRLQMYPSRPGKAERWGGFCPGLLRESDPGEWPCDPAGCPCNPAKCPCDHTLWVNLVFLLAQRSFELSFCFGSCWRLSLGDFVFWFVLSHWGCIEPFGHSTVYVTGFVNLEDFFFFFWANF